MKRTRLIVDRIGQVMTGAEWISFFFGFGFMFGYSLAEFGRIFMFAGILLAYPLAIAFLAINWKPLTKELVCGSILFGLLGSMFFQCRGLLVGLVIGPFIAYWYNVLVLKRNWKTS